MHLSPNKNTHLTGREPWRLAITPGELETFREETTIQPTIAPIVQEAMWDPYKIHLQQGTGAQTYDQTVTNRLHGVAWGPICTLFASDESSFTVRGVKESRETSLAVILPVISERHLFGGGAVMVSRGLEDCTDQRCCANSPLPKAMEISD